MSSIFSQIPQAAYPLGLGLLTTSSLLFGNIGLTLTGPLPIVKGELGTVALSGKQKLGVWDAFFDAAAYYVVRGTLLTSALHLLTVPLLPTQNLKILAATSAITSLTIFPYTGLFILPTIDTLKTLDKKDELTTAEDKEVDRLIRKWDSLHKVRYAAYAPAWAMGLATLVGLLAL